MSVGIAILLLLCFIVLFVINVPIAFVLGIVGTLGLMITESIPLPAFAQLMSASVDSFPLVAIPLFVLAGLLMTEAGMSEQLVDFAKILFGRFRGGLLLVATGTAMLFGAITGSATADAAAVGTILMPSMLKERYNREFSTALVAVAGCLGAVIPPSINLVVIGYIGGISIWKLFIGSILPGVVTGMGLMVISYIHSVRAGYKPNPSLTRREIARISVRAIVPLALPVIILGGIYSGKFTPTEAAATAATYALVVALAARRLTLRGLYTSFAQTAKISAGPMLMVATAGLFSYFMVMARIPEAITQGILGSGMSPTSILLSMNVLLFIIGMLMDTLPAMIILVPIFLPIAASIGMDPVHFGVMIGFNCSMAMATPPVGVALFASCAVSKTSVGQVMKPMMLMTAYVFLMVLIVTYVPSLSLALVR